MTAPRPCSCGCDTTDRATKISHGRKGWKPSAQTLARMAEGQQRRYVDGMPAAEREAISRAQRGKKHPPDCNHCASIKGANNPRWNNGSSQKGVLARLRRYGGEFDPTVTRRAVLDRDDWTCRLCGDAIPDLTWDNAEAQPLYGTIDHIVPVSEQGDHTWANVQAAHLRCNSLRWYATCRGRTTA